MKTITKLLSITGCVMLSLEMAACAPKQDDTTQYVNPLDNLNMPYFAETESTPVSTENLYYDIQKGHYLVGVEGDNTTEVYYPQVDSVSSLPEGTEQEIVMERINDDILKTVLLREGSTNFFAEQNAASTATAGESKREAKYIMTNYRVQTANEKIISVLYEEAISTFGHAANYGAVGTTISLQENRILQLNEMITDFDALLSLMETDQFTPIPYYGNEAPPFSQVLEDASYMREELLEIFKNNNKRTFFTEEDDSDKILWEARVFDWYLWDNKLVMVYLGNKYYNQYYIELDEIRDIIDDTFYENYIQL